MKKIGIDLLMIASQGLAMEQSLIENLLTNEDTGCDVINGDMSRLLGQCIIRDQGIAPFLLKRIGITNKSLRGYAGSVVSAHFNGTGDKVVTPSADGTAKILDTESGTCLATLAGHTKTVRSAHFNGTGDKIVTTSWDKTAKIWDISEFLECENFLSSTISFNQAFILTCIYEIIVSRRLVDKYGDDAYVEAAPEEEGVLVNIPFRVADWLYSYFCKRSDSISFDFRQYPHLQEHYDVMPQVIQRVLAPYVTK